MDKLIEIIKKLPDTIKSDYCEIWKDYQNQTSPESQIVHQIDRLEMALQAKMYQKQGYSKEDIEIFLESAKTSITHPKLKELLDQIVEE